MIMLLGRSKLVSSCVKSHSHFSIGFVVKQLKVKRTNTGHIVVNWEVADVSVYYIRNECVQCSRMVRCQYIQGSSTVLD